MNPPLLSSTSAFNPYQIEFPPLERGRTLKIRDAFERGRSKDVGTVSSLRSDQHAIPNTLVKPGAGESSTVPASLPETPNIGVNTSSPTKSRSTADLFKATPAATTNGPQFNGEEGVGIGAKGFASPIGAEKGPEAANVWRSMAEMIKRAPEPNGPQVFVPDKIQAIGHASTSNGIPSIYFSGLEIQKLAENLGHAIVGKFSHSIPTAGQIQKALNNMKFQCGFTWKYINAKHILIQCEGLADYARILSGPKGTPVWLIDRHPMRVFKWSPDFDAYCESPIAAIWCNLIGLPIHLFDQSALFAIGKLLGTPIQVDRATANKTRLSFARICVEIDITKPPPEEIILDICGREMVQQVRWDKIPAYCRECKHVGHSSDVCYAVGKTERPPKRNYNSATMQKANQEGNGSTEKQANMEPKPNDNNEWRRQGRNKGKGIATKAKPNGEKRVEPDWEGPDIVGDLQDDHVGDGHVEGQIIPSMIRGEDAAITYSMGLSRSNSKNGELMDASWEDGDTTRQRVSSSRGGSRGGLRGRGRYPSSNLGRSGDEWMGNVMSTNKYYSFMANGEFDVDGCGETDAVEMDIQTLDAHPKVTPLQIVDGDQTREDDQKIVVFQGGPSNLPGTTSSC